MGRGAGLGRFWTLDMIFLLVVAAVALVFVIEGLRLDLQTGLFPAIMGLSTLILALANLMMRARRPAPAAPAQPVVQAPATAPQAARPGIVRYYAFAAAFVFYVMSMNLVGFVVATLAFCLVMPAWMGLRSYLKVGAFGILTTALVTVLFREVFLIRLPEGILWSWILGG